MVGVPMFSGFISKLLFSQAAVQNDGKMLPTLIVLGISTILNAIYFMKTVIRIYTPVEEGEYPTVQWQDNKIYGGSDLFCGFKYIAGRMFPADCGPDRVGA